MWAWFLAGCGVAVFLIATQAIVLNGLAGLLLVGEDSQLRPFVESYLGSVPVVSGPGHDGQIYFAIAHDLDGDVVSKLINNPGIRYRRPLLPVLASLGGLVKGQAVLLLTVGWITIGFGASAAAFRALLHRLHARPIWMAVLFAYPGFWISTRLLTPDMVALGLALVALVLFLRGATVTPVLAFTLAALAKEVFVVVALAAGAWTFFRSQRARGMAVAGIPLVALVGYATIVLDRFEAPAVDGNLGLPFTGINAAKSFWPSTSVADQVYVAVALGMLVVAVVSLWVAKSSLVRWLIAPWPLVGLISSGWIWRLGNGAIRSFAPVVLFIALAVAERAKGLQVDEDP